MDKDFFVQELEARSGMMYRVAYTILHDDDACRDALQDAALKAWEKRATLRQTEYFHTWITRILINTWNVICQGRIYPILKFLSHNTHIFIKIAKETVVRCLFCRIGYEQSFHYGFVLIRWLSLFSEGSPQIIVLTYMISKNQFVSHHTMGIVRFRSHDCYTVDLSNYQYLKCYLA